MLFIGAHSCQAIRYSKATELFKKGKLGYKIGGVMDAFGTLKWGKVRDESLEFDLSFRAL